MTNLTEYARMEALPEAERGVVKGIACHKCGIMVNIDGNKVGETYSMYSAALRGFFEGLCPKCNGVEVEKPKNRSSLYDPLLTEETIPSDIEVKGVVI